MYEAVKNLKELKLKKNMLMKLKMDLQQIKQNRLVQSQTIKNNFS